MGAGLRTGELEGSPIENYLQFGSLELNGSVEFLNSVLEALLIQEDLATKPGVQVR